MTAGRGLTSLIGVVALVLVAGVVQFAAVSPAMAAKRCENRLVSGMGQVPVYKRVCWEVREGESGDVTPAGGRSDGRPAPDTCNLAEKGGPAGSFCVGTRICYIDETADPDQYRPPGPPPTPPARYVVRMCLARANAADDTLTRPIFDQVILLRPGDDPAAVDPLVQFREAYGTLEAPEAGIGFNPPNRAVVNVPTWFWTAGFPAEITGDEVLGLVAVATRATTTWDLGDGTTLSCPDGGTAYAAGRTSTCTHTFRRSSAGQRARDGNDDPAYRVTATRRWNVHFELDGEPVPVPGGTDEFTTLQLTDTVDVPVREIQSVGDSED